MSKEHSGGFAFACILVVIAFLFVVCVVLPLAVPNFSKQPYALPLMGVGLALPFIHFFIFGGMALAQKKKDDKKEAAEE